MENQTIENTSLPLSEESKTEFRKLPGFVLNWITIDLAFCSLKGFFVCLGTLGFLYFSREPLINFGMVSGLFLNLMIFIFGIPADIMILCKKSLGVKIACISIFFTICNMLINLSGMDLKSSNENDFESAVGLVIRGGLLLYYCKAVLRAKAFFAECEALPKTLSQRVE